MPVQSSANFFLPQFQSALGTVVHATPIVEALKEALPDCRVIVASSGLAAQVWQGNPHIEQLLHTPNPLQEMWGAIRAWRAARLFGGAHYTTLLSTGNERTRLTLAAMLTGRSTRVGFAVHGALVQRHLVFNPAHSQIWNNLRLLPACGVALRNEHLEPRLYPDSEDRCATELLASLPRPRIALATQTSATQRKSWPAERWVQLAGDLRASYGAELLFIGTAAEAAAIDEIRRSIPFATTSIAGRTTIPQLAAVLAGCDLGVMLDTGPLHVARGVGLPAVVIAPAWSPVHEWLPIHQPDYRILKNRDFPPPAPDDYVISEVSVEEVVAAVADLWTTRSTVAAGERILES